VVLCAHRTQAAPAAKIVNQFKLTLRFRVKVMVQGMVDGGHATVSDTLRERDNHYRINTKRLRGNPRDHKNMVQEKNPSPRGCG